MRRKLGAHTDENDDDETTTAPKTTEATNVARLDKSKPRENEKQKSNARLQWMRRKNGVGGENKK